MLVINIKHDADKMTDMINKILDAIYADDLGEGDFWKYELFSSTDSICIYRESEKDVLSVCIGDENYYNHTLDVTLV